jgi:ABC-type multidrug transport system ATPase subunit
MLDIRDVSKRYGALTAVSHVSFAIAPREVLGYLGPNGSGKSTTVKILAGLIAPTSGTVLSRRSPMPAPSSSTARTNWTRSSESAHA